MNLRVRALVTFLMECRKFELFYMCFRCLQNYEGSIHQFNNYVSFWTYGSEDDFCAPWRMLATAELSMRITTPCFHMAFGTLEKQSAF